MVQKAGRSRIRKIASAVCVILSVTPVWASEPLSSDTLEAITVTARKRQESALDVPVSITAFSAQMLQDYQIQSFTNYATKIPNLSFSYGAGAASNAGLGFSASRGTAIRGITGSNATGIYIDDTPVFDSMDPRIVDIDRIEVLKGPQGTLYGSGSLGGNIRIITNKPSLTKDDARYGVDLSDTRHGSVDYGGQAAANFVLIPNVVATRLMGFYSKDSGFITRTFPSVADPNVRTSVDGDGEVNVLGGSMATLIHPVEGLDITLRLLYQRQYTFGWPAAFAPLPAFKVVSYTVDRTVNVQEGSSDRWTLPSIDVNYKGQSWALASSTSYFERTTFDHENGTEGTSYALAGAGFTALPGMPLLWYGNDNTTRFAHETRVSFDEMHHLSGIAGVYYANKHLNLLLPPAATPGLAASGLWPNDNSYSYTGSIPTTESAIFGEVYLSVLPKLTLTLGARAYRLKEQSSSVSDGFFQGGQVVQPLTSSDEHGVSPKYALDYHLTADSMVYASASKGFRPGGINNPLPNTCTTELNVIGLTPDSVKSFKSDSVWNYELGTKASFFERRLTMTAAVFQIDWKQIQQPIYLPICSYSITGNSGAARNKGAELEVNARPSEGLQLRAAAGYLDATISEAGASSPQAVGSRVFNIPKLTASAGTVYEFPVAAASATGFLSADYSYVGDSLSGNNTTTEPRRRPSYQIVNLRAGLRRDKNELSLFVDNVFNEKANLGDLVGLSFEPRVTNAQGQSEPNPRVVALRPLQIGLQYRHGF